MDGGMAWSDKRPDEGTDKGVDRGWTSTGGTSI